LVHELQSSNQGMSLNMNSENIIQTTSDNRSVDEESLSLSSGLESRRLRNPRRAPMPPPPPPARGGSVGSSQRGGYTIPHMGGGGGESRIPSDPSVASSRRSGRSANSSRYSRDSSRSHDSSKDMGEEDPVGYVMPMGMGMFPDGTVYTQNTSSVYGNNS
jgi:hypothetical protein